jgi:hypothetical protein
VDRFKNQTPVLNNKSSSGGYDSYSNGTKEEEIVAEEVIRETSEIRGSISQQAHVKETYSSVVEEELVALPAEEEEYSDPEMEPEMSPEMHSFEKAKYEPTLSEIMKASPPPCSAEKYED